MSIESALQSALVSAVGTACSPTPVRARNDNSNAMTATQVLVSVQPADKTRGNSKSIQAFDVELMAYCEVSADKSQSTLLGIHDTLETYANTLRTTPSGLTVTGATVKGLVFQVGSELMEQSDVFWAYRTVKFTLFLQVP